MFFVIIPPKNLRTSVSIRESVLESVDRCPILGRQGGGASLSPFLPRTSLSLLLNVQRIYVYLSVDVSIPFLPPSFPATIWKEIVKQIHSVFDRSNRICYTILNAKIVKGRFS